MPVDLSSLQIILDGIPDKARVKRLIDRFETEGLDQQTICWSERAVIELKKKMEQHLTNHTMATTNSNRDELLNSTQASEYIRVGMTSFIAYKNAGLVQVANQIGNKHFFSRKHLDNFLAIPPHQRNMMLAEARANAPSKEPRWRRKKSDRGEQVHADERGNEYT